MASVACLLDPYLNLPPYHFPFCSLYTSRTALLRCSKHTPILRLLHWLYPLLGIVLLCISSHGFYSLTSSKLCSNITFSVKLNLYTLFKLAAHPLLLSGLRPIQCVLNFFFIALISYNTEVLKLSSCSQSLNNIFIATLAKRNI